MRRHLLAIPLVALLAITVAAQDAITITIAPPRPGERAKVTIEEKTTTKSVFTVGGMTQGKDEVKTKSLIYIDETLENPKNTRRPTKLKRTFEKAILVVDGQKLNLPVEGKTVLIEKKGDKYSFTVDGRRVTGDSLKMLDEEYNQPGQGEVRDLMFPKKPVRPGESWKIDPAELAKTIGEKGPTFAVDKLTATGTLVKAYKKDGRQYGEVEFSFDAPLINLGPNNPVAVKEGKMTMKLTGDGCLDGTVATGKSTTKMSLGLTGSTMGIDLKVAVENTENRTVEALPKK
jgi:hypothetical protein